MQTDHPHRVEIHFLVLIGLRAIGQLKQSIVCVVKQILQQLVQLLFALLADCMNDWGKRRFLVPFNV